MGCASVVDAKSNQNKFIEIKQFDSKNSWSAKLSLRIMEGSLQKEIKIQGKMDPYCKIFLGKQKALQSRVSEDGGQFPKWNQVFELEKGHHDDCVVIQVWNQNLISHDNYIGEGALSLYQGLCRQMQENEQFVPIFQKGDPIGSIRVTFLLELPESEAQRVKVEPPSRGTVMVKPVRAELSRQIVLYSQVDSMLTFQIGKAVTQSSIAYNSALRPTWNDTLNMNKGEKDDILRIDCWNFNEIGENDLIGSCFVSLTNLFLQKDSNPIQKYLQLAYENQQAGTLEVILQYTPDSVTLEKTSTVQAEGEQSITYENGSVYKGQISNGLREGSGECTYRQSALYKGQWKNDLWHGEGIYQMGTSKYEGNFENGKRNGYGVMKWQNGESYEGNWKDDNYHGTGEWVFKDGTRKKGIFQNGRRIKWLDETEKHLPSGRVINQGAHLSSQSGQYQLFISQEGKITVMNNETQMIHSEIQNQKTDLKPPFFLKLEDDGSLSAYDTLGKYFSTEKSTNSQPPFKLIVCDDGNLQIKDSRGKMTWKNEI